MAGDLATSSNQDALTLQAIKLIVWGWYYLSTLFPTTAALTAYRREGGKCGHVRDVRYGGHVRTRCGYVRTIITRNPTDGFITSGTLSLARGILRPVTKTSRTTITRTSDRLLTHTANLPPILTLYRAKTGKITRNGRHRRWGCPSLVEEAWGGNLLFSMGYSLFSAYHKRGQLGYCVKTSYHFSGGTPE